jgi:hypothetical protein
LIFPRPDLTEQKGCETPFALMPGVGLCLNMPTSANKKNEFALSSYLKATIKNRISSLTKSIKKSIIILIQKDKK